MKPQRRYSTGQAATILGVHLKTVVKLCKLGALPSCLVGSRLRIDHEGLVEYMRANRMMDELARMGLGEVNILLCGMDQHLAENLDDLIDESMALHVADNGFELGWQIRDLRPGLIVLDGHNWGWPAFIGLIRWIKTRDPEVKILALLCEDWVNLPTEVMRLVYAVDRHPVTASKLFVYVQSLFITAEENPACS